MTSSLYAALSGLQAHQSWIDVIGNNLANASTPGFKTSSATFSDQFSQTLRYASGPSTGLGGRNPVQVGQGVRLSDIGRNFAQGGLTSTGRTFDVALEGRGFFTLANGAQTLYTRVGTFGTDADRNLVDKRTGYRVLGSNGSPITIDDDALYPPQATTMMQFTGNLPAFVTGPLPEVLTGVAGLKDGDPAMLTSGGTGPFTIPIGETWTMDVIASGGAPQEVSITSTTGTVTAAEIATAIDALDDVSAVVNGSGAIEVTSDRTGEDVSIKVDAGPTGRDLAQLAGFSTLVVHGTESALTPTSTLNDLPGNITDYVAGDVIRISGVDTDDTAISSTFTYGTDGTTVEELIDFIDNIYTNATVSLNSSGQIVVEADQAGETGLTLTISDDSTSTGDTQWSQYALNVTTQGTPPDEVNTSMEVYDPAGVAHTMTFSYQRQDDGTWTITSSMPEGEGQVLSPPITGLTFGDDGTPLGLSSLDTDVTVQFTGQNAAQTFQLDLGEDGAFSGLTHFGESGDVFVRLQDGYGVGELASMSVDGDGSIQGFYTNGQKRALGDIGVTTFVNPEGLQQVSDNMFAASVNSGSPNLGSGNLAGAGKMVGGSLENSNVDTAEQFVHLIEAQRGFQANARMITAQDEMLRETVNLV